MRPLVGAKRRNEAIQALALRSEKELDRTKIDQTGWPINRKIF